jgi:biotin transport system substrate-specific component
LIAAGLPLDARGLGAAVFAGPTWGYLVAFIPCAFVAGWLVERSSERVWQRVAAGLVGLVIVYALGTTVLAYMTQRTLSEAFALGVVPFIAGDVAKAIFAGLLNEGMRATLLRLLNPVQ